MQKSKSISEKFEQILRSKKQNQNNNKDDVSSMNLLVQRLKSLIHATIETQKDLENKLNLLSMINHHDEHKDNASLDVDIAFGDESYTLDAIRQSLESLKNDKNQIQVYKS